MYNFIVDIEPDESNIRLTERFARHAQDFDDLQNEMAGRDVGRISRFVTADAREDISNGKHGSRKDANLTNLQILMMNNRAYAELFRETVKRLHEAQDRLDFALDTVLRTKAETEERLKDARTEAERQAMQDHLDELAQLENEIRNGQDEIGGMQVQMEDEDNPPSKSDLDDFQKRADEIEAKVLPEVQALTGPATDAPVEDAKPSFTAAEIDIPKL